METIHIIVLVFAFIGLFWLVSTFGDDIVEVVLMGLGIGLFFALINLLSLFLANSFYTVTISGNSYYIVPVFGGIIGFIIGAIGSIAEKSR